MKKRVDPDRFGTPMAKTGPRERIDYLEGSRWKLLVAYVTPLIVLALYFHFEYSAMLRAGIDNGLRSVAENRRNTVDLFLMERVANLRYSVPADADPAGFDSARLQTVLEALRMEAPSFVDIGIFQPDGRLAAYAGEYLSLLGKDYGAEPWFRRLRNSDQDYIVSDVFMGFRGAPHFIIAQKRERADGEWVIRASVDPRAFGRLVESSFLTAGREAYIVNPAGVPQTFTSSSEDTGDSAQPPPVQSANTRVDEFEVDGASWVAAYAWLTETEWAVVVRVPTDIAYAPLRRARRGVFGILALAIIVTVTVILRSTRRMARRLEATDHDREDLQRHLFNAAKLASVGEMAAGVAHEINNPLAIVYEEAAMMEDLLDPQFAAEFSPEEFRERLSEIKGAALRGREITRNLLAFSRRHEPEPEPTDINELLARVVEVRRQAMAVADIEVIQEFGRDLPTVLVNRNQMEQVLLNLVNNAMDAIGNDGRISLRTRSADDFVEVDIEDTGHGMSEEVMRQVFFPFFTTKSVGRGTGLGLSISYGIVKASGGRIVLWSEEGVGTKFTLSLPISECTSAQPRIREAIEGDRDE